MAEFLVGFHLVQKYYNFAIILNPLVWLGIAYLVLCQARKISRCPSFGFAYSCMLLQLAPTFYQNSGLCTASLLHLLLSSYCQSEVEAEIGVGGNNLHTSIKTWMLIYQSRHFFDIPGLSGLRCNQCFETVYLRTLRDLHRKTDNRRDVGLP